MPDESEEGRGGEGTGGDPNRGTGDQMERDSDSRLSWRQTSLSISDKDVLLQRLIYFFKFCFTYNFSSAEILNFIFFFWPCPKACGILVPQLGMEPTPPVLEAQSLNH